ncbi:MAG: arginase [Alphaproteobacteria bacterium]|nr:arginase [Alphaproteobacteria bacterium]
MASDIDIGTMFGAGGADTFMGLPPCFDVTQIEAKIGLIGVPCATPYPSVGPYCSGAPAAMRAVMSHYGDNIQHMDFDLGGRVFPDGEVCAVDCGDLPYDENEARANRKRIRDAVCWMLDRGAVPIVMGGDDSIPIPVVQSFEGRGDLTILQIDAHIDWREEVGGVQMGLSSTMRRSSETPHVTKIIQAGQRAIGSARPEDYEDAVAWGTKFITAQKIHKEGTAQVIEQIDSGSDVLISLDVDALDPSIVPAVLGPAPGGLSYYQVVEMIQGVAGKARIAGFNIVELFPERDVNGLGALNAARIVINALGHVARQVA